MKGVERFEDLVAWQKARQLAKAIYLTTQQPAFVNNAPLSGQLQKSAVAVMSIIVEGFERGSYTDFHRYLGLAIASCAELRSQLYVALDTDCMTRGDFDQLSAQAQELTRIIVALRASLERQWKSWSLR